MLDKDRGEEERKVCIHIYKKDRGKKKEKGRKEREKRKGRETLLVDTDAGKGSRKCPLVRGIYM